MSDKNKKDSGINKTPEKKEKVSKTFIGIAGALIGAAGVAAWNNRDKILEKSASAKERAVELKEKTNTLVEVVKERINEINLKKEKSNLSELTVEEDVKEITNLSEETETDTKPE